MKRKNIFILSVFIFLLVGGSLFWLYSLKNSDSTTNLNSPFSLEMLKNEYFDSDSITIEYGTSLGGRYSDMYICPGSSTSYDFTLKNVGVLDDTFLFNAESKNGWVDNSLIEKEFFVPAKEEKIITVTLSVPETAQVGESDSIMFRAAGYGSQRMGDSKEITIFACDPAENEKCICD